MKAAKIIKVLSMITVIGFFMTIVVFAQDTTKKDDGITKLPDGTYKSKEHDESNRPDDSYLAKFHARDIVDKLIKTNLEQIYLLKVIVTNFSDKGWKGEYDKVYSGYKDAMEQYYKRNLIYARVKLENNRKDIIELLKKIIEEYTKDVDVMLGECATKVLTLHLDSTSRSDPNRFDALYTNHLRLRIAYGEMDDASSATIDKYFEGAVFHLRNAKSYAITILEDLAKPDEKDSVKSKYKIHKADNLNRIYAESKETKTQ